MGAPRCQQDLNAFEDPSKLVLKTTIYTYDNIIYPATFSKVLNQNRSESFSSCQPSYLLASTLLLRSISFSGCLNTKEVLLHKSFHLKPHFQSWFFWLHCVATSQPLISHIHFKMLQSSRVSLSVCPRPPLSLEHPGGTPDRVMMGSHQK